jgi:hypothetical protein
VSIAIDLLTRGYFPAEVPPPFVTKSLGNHALAKGIPQLLQLAGTGKSRWAFPVRHNYARAGGLRRQLSIPNPMGYMELASELDTGWKGTLKPLLAKARLCASRPIPSGGVRAFRKAGEKQIERLKAVARRMARYVVHADIQNFYPSIYTHSVPWVLHGKTQAKAAPKDKTLLGNRLDWALQACQGGQTVGIAIGPDASLVIAESILARVESDLNKQFKALSGYRWIDDFQLYFSSLGEAEKCLVALQELLSHYELSLNPRKTRISPLPEPQEASGIWLLRRWEFDDKPRAQSNDLIGYFDEAFRQIAQDPGGSLAAYAIGRLKSFTCHKQNWELLQSLMFQMLITEPSCSRFIMEVLALQEKAGNVVGKKEFRDAAETIAKKHAAMGHGSEVAWMLWGSIANKVPLSARTAKAISGMDDCLVALLALHAHDLGLAPKGLDVSQWATSMTTDQLRGENWLLAYEASVKGWLPSSGAADHIQPDAFFSALRTAGVSFYDVSALAIHPTQVAVPAGSLAVVSGVV